MFERAGALNHRFYTPAPFFNNPFSVNRRLVYRRPVTITQKI